MAFTAISPGGGFVEGAADVAVEGGLVSTILISHIFADLLCLIRYSIPAIIFQMRPFVNNSQYCVI